MLISWNVNHMAESTAISPIDLVKPSAFTSSQQPPRPAKKVFPCTPSSTVIHQGDSIRSTSSTRGLSLAKMSKTITGGCNCGRYTYTIPK